VGRAALADPSLSPGAEFTPREAYFDLCDEANASGGSFTASVRTLAVRWGWSKSRTHRFLAARAERGQVGVEEIPARGGLRITIAPPWDGSGTPGGTLSGTPGGTEKPHEDGVPHQSAGQSAGHLAGRSAGPERDTSGASPSLHSPPPTEGEQNTWEGARAHEERSQSETKYVAARADIQRLVKLLSERLLFGEVLEGALWDEQAVTIRALIERHGPGKVEQAIVGAGKRNCWPFDKKEPVLAVDLRRHFGKALAAAKANGNGTAAAPKFYPEVKAEKEKANEEWLVRIEKKIMGIPKIERQRMIQRVREQWNLHPEQVEDKDQKQRIRRALKITLYQEYGRQIGDPSPLAP
jgi:hypothetical protein